MLPPSCKLTATTTAPACNYIKGGSTEDAKTCWRFAAGSGTGWQNGRRNSATRR